VHGVAVWRQADRIAVASRAEMLMRSLALGIGDYLVGSDSLFRRRARS
jgi:hypothetical protein